MRKLDYIIFFGTFFTVYGLTNLYIFIRGWQALQFIPQLKVFYVILFLIISLSFITGRILERFWLSILSDVLVWIGSFWLAAMLYFFLIIVIVDLFRIVNHFLPFYSYPSQDYEKLKAMAGLITLGGVGAILLSGYINASIPRIKHLQLNIDKVCAYDSLKIAVASDIHLGTIVGRKRFCKIVNKINEQKPDIVLLPGDIVDEDLGPVIKQNLGEALLSIKSNLGTFAITGNHEYIGGVEEACIYLLEHNIKVLRDSTAQIENCLYIVGREDRSISQFSGKKRKALGELLNMVDKSRPVILLDHQPFQLEEAVEQKIDLQLSGHTHHGQLWPFNFITRAIYEKSWGYLKKGSTQFYISSGVGTWGPPIRTSCYPEIVCLKLNFKAH